MTVNMSKTKITVFRNGRFLADNEVQRYGDEENEDVHSCKSLEVYFTTRLSLIQAVGKDQNQPDTQISIDTRKCTEKVYFILFFMYDAQILACPGMSVCLQT